MKKKIIAFSMIVVILFLTGFMADKRKITAEVSEKEKEDIRFTGTWYLSSDNDIRSLEETFPDIYAFGNELTIRPDGKIYWHIGAAGAAGTYETYGNQLKACVADIMEYDEYMIAFTMDDNGNLNMKYKSVQ